MLILWIILIVTVATLLLIDFGLLYRRIAHISLPEAIALSSFWLVIGLSFALFIFFAYEQSWFNDYLPMTGLSGKQAVIQYLNVYLLEKSLSLDNMFVIAITFQSLAIPVHFQHRVLLVGIVSAIIMRTLIIIGGITLLQSYTWMHYALGVILLLASIKLIANHTLEKRRDNNLLTRLVGKFVPIRESIDDGRFVLRKNNRLMITPLFIAMILIESADLYFSTDSIPAALSVSSDSFIVVSANIFALMGLRALYFVLASAMQQLHYMKLSLVLVLLFLAAKMLLLEIYPIDDVVTLLAITGILVTGIVTSLLQKDRNPILATSPLAAEIGRIYNLTFASLKRIIVLVIGISVVIIGIIMIVTPGPAIVVIPAGLAILATEFVWARIILKKFKNKLLHYGKETMNIFRPGNNHSDKDSK